MAAFSPPRLRRSVLFLPGSNPRTLEKARTLPADGLIFDLEDAVAPDAKDLARAAVAAALTAGGYAPRELILRVNRLDSAWGHADLAAAARLPLDAVLLPKVENAERVRLTLDLLDAMGAPPELAIWAMVETPLGVLAAADTAAASQRLAALVLGTSDLTADLHVREAKDRLPLLAALGLVLLAARAHGKAGSSTCPTPTGSPRHAGRGANSASTARRSFIRSRSRRPMLHSRRPRRRLRRPAQSSPPTPMRQRAAKVRSASAAGLSRRCTSLTPAASWRSPTRSRRAAANAAPYGTLSSG